MSDKINAQYFQIHENCTFVTFLDIGNSKTALCVVNPFNQVHFYQVEKFEDKDTQGNIVNVKLIKLGIQDPLPQDPKLVKSKVYPTEMRYNVMLDHRKIYNKNGLAGAIQEGSNFTFSMLLVWSDKSYEFYSDFNMVSSSLT